MTPGGSKRGENEFLGKKRKRHVLTLPKTKFHAKNQKNLSRGFPGKWGKRDRQTERDGPEYKGPPDAIAKPSDQKNNQKSKKKGLTVETRKHLPYSLYPYHFIKSNEQNFTPLWVVQSMRTTHQEWHEH